MPRIAPSGPAYGVSTTCERFDDEVHPRTTRATMRMTRFISPPFSGPCRINEGVQARCRTFTLCDVPAKSTVLNFRYIFLARVIPSVARDLDGCAARRPRSFALAQDDGERRHAFLSSAICPA